MTSGSDHPPRKDRPGRGPQGRTEQQRRSERLAAALRENLRKRKAQRRGRTAPDEPPDPERR